MSDDTRWAGRNADKDLHSSRMVGGPRRPMEPHDPALHFIPFLKELRAKLGHARS